MRVYVAGAYTKGDVALNIRRVIEVADKLVAAGHTPFVPHLYHLWHLISPKDYEVWMRLGQEWLLVCEAMIRLPGDSSGSDDEESVAWERGIPVYNDVETFLRSEVL